jgi:type IV fimbrial biogenesis protein FimT
MGARRPSGFSIMEVMVVVGIIGLLIAAAIPNFVTWTQNTQIRTAGESIVNGLQTARNEAVRRNACMQLEMKGRTEWWVNPCQSPDVDPPFMRRVSEEGSVNATTNILPNGSTIVSFSALGRIVAPNPSDGSVPITTIQVQNPTMTAGTARELRIEVPPGGSIRMCDPHPGVLAGDPRRCN